MAENDADQPQQPEPPKQRTCGTMPVHERLLRTNPAYLRARIASENYHHEFMQRGSIGGRTGVTTIPVVVHVVFNTAVQNISDAQIHSQIDVLNRDYRLKNADTSSVPAPYKPLAIDARIEFVLANTDPHGNPTNGITRTQTAEAAFTDDDKVKSAASGGADPWPANKYLNLWVCQLGGGLLGYAQFPGGPAATDGVVILHTGFGTTGTAAAPFNLGRTATHEVGHWLNLRHIWGDDGNGCNGSDFVADTPNQADHNFGTPTFPHVTCNNGPNGDMFMNYMDYTDDRAMFMFTVGQVVRMQACLDGDRPTIGTTAGSPGTIKFNEDTPVTLKFNDDNPPATLKFNEDTPVTLKFNDDNPPGTLKFIEDAPPTLKFNEDAPPPTLKFRDDNPPTLKFNEDAPPGTLKFREDNPPTLKFREDIPKLKIVDDGIPGPPFGLPGPGPQFGSLVGSQGIGGFGRTPAAPFVLSTPHHSMAWAAMFPQAAQGAVASAEQQLRQYEEALNMYSQAEASGQLDPSARQQAEAIYQDYLALTAEYRRLTGQ